MGQRIARLFDLICKESQSHTVEKLAAHFSITARTIYNDIDRLNEWLIRSSFAPISIDKGTVIYSTVLTITFEDLVKKELDFIYSDPKLRRLRITQYIFSCNDYFSVDDLREKFDISRNTLLKDLKLIKEELAFYSIDLESRPFQGYKLIGDEMSIRTNFMAVIEEDLLYFDQEVSEEDQLFLANVEEFIHNFSKQLSLRFSDLSFERLLLAFWVSFRRIAIHKNVQFPTVLESFSKEEQLLFEYQDLLNSLFKEPLSKDELLYLAKKISEVSIIHYQETLTEDWLSFHLLVDELVKNIQKHFSSIDLIHDETLYKGILTHLRPAYKRAIRQEWVENPLFDYIVSNYQELHFIIKKEIEHLEQKLAVQFNDQEISYFTLIFASSFERKKKIIKKKIRAIIVCDAGMSTSEILKSKLDYLFDLIIVKTFSVREAKQWLLTHQVDLVLTTVPIILENQRVIQVSPFLTFEDKSKLRDALQPLDKEINIQELVTIFKRYKTLTKYESANLSEELAIYFGQTTRQKIEGERYQPMLKEVLTEELIQVNYDAADSIDAVTTAGNLLVKKHLAKESYIEGMLENLKVNGTYIVIAPGIAMPHARPETGALDIGFSILTLANPVVFGHPKNDPVQLVVGLCAVDHHTHLKALAELVTILGDEEKLQKILSAKSSAEIMIIIKGDD